MSDQADTLRKLMQQRNILSASGKKPRGREGVPVFTFSSGKGGVGKSCAVANLGTMLARSGLRVLLVDSDFGLANLDLLLGVQVNATLEQVLAGEASLQEAIVGVEPNLWLVPASAGLMDFRRSDPETRLKLIRLFENLPWAMDAILVDVGAGIHEHVLSVHHSSYESVIVVTPEPTSITDAYGLVKLLKKSAGITQVNVIVNQVTDAREAQRAFQGLKDVASRFLDVQLEYLGHWERDEKITQAVMKRKILLDLDPGAISIPCLELLSKRIRSRCGTAESGTARPSRGPSKGSIGLSARIMDEPARVAPGNTAGFVRTLLGEVKA